MMVEEKKTYKPIKTLRRAAVLAVAICLVAAVCFGLGFAKGGSKTETPPKLDVVMVSDRLEEVKKLVTVEYNYTNMGQFEQHGEFYGVKLPFTTKRFIVSYDGVICAGIDWAQGTSITINNDQRINVRIPNAIIISHEIDEDSLQVFDETRNIFNPITIEDYTGFQNDQKDAMEQKAVENGLLTQAKTNAQTVIRQFLTPLAQEYGMELAVQ